MNIKCIWKEFDALAIERRAVQGHSNSFGEVYVTQQKARGQTFQQRDDFEIEKSELREKRTGNLDEEMGRAKRVTF